VKTAPRKRAGYRVPAASVMAAAKVPAAETMTATVVTATVVTTAMMTAAMASTMTAAVASAAFADCHAGQQGRQSNDRNSDCRFENSDSRFGHGTALLRHPFIFAAGKNADGRRKFHWRNRPARRKDGILHRRHDLPGIEDVLRIERRLQRAHGLDRLGAEFGFEIFLLALADTVLAGAGAAH
jgi:hypothetical protein